jgi:hypothetical protein
MRDGVQPLVWAFIGPRYDLSDWVYKDVPLRVKAAYLETGPDSRCQSGGAIGVDTLARNAWNSLPGVQRCKDIRPNYDRSKGYAYNAARALERNGEIVKADRVVAWWNGVSRGTRKAMEKAQRRGSLWEVRFFNEAVWSKGDPYDPFSYGQWMAEHMYKASQLKFAGLLLTQKIERSESLSPVQKQQYALRVTEGQHWLERGNRPKKRDDGSLFFGPMRQPDRAKLGVEEEARGHTVNLGMECTCEAHQHGRPCWARAAAWIVRYVEGYRSVGVVPNTEELEHEIMEQAA